MARETLNELMKIAARQTMAVIGYKKPFDAEASVRVIEPYDLQQHCGNLMVRAWQVDPDVSRTDAWRNFRIDRILAVSDSRQPFKPRCRQRMLDGEVSDWKMEEESFPTDPIEIYEKSVNDALRDRRVSKEELEAIKRARRGLSDPEMRAVHARVYADALNELANDDDVDSVEMKYAKDLRQFLEHLGWAP